MSEFAEGYVGMCMALISLWATGQRHSRTARGAANANVNGETREPHLERRALLWYTVRFEFRMTHKIESRDVIIETDLPIFNAVGKSAFHRFAHGSSVRPCERRLPQFRRDRSKYLPTPFFRSAKNRRTSEFRVRYVVLTPVLDPKTHLAGGIAWSV